MIKDNLGNDLAPGQLVQMIGDHGDAQYCHVVSVEQGGTPEIIGTSLTTKSPIKPAVIVLQPATLTIQCIPNKHVPFLTVVKEPEKSPS